MGYAVNRIKIGMRQLYSGISKHEVRELVMVWGAIVVMVRFRLRVLKELWTQLYTVRFFRKPSHREQMKLLGTFGHCSMMEKMFIAQTIPMNGLAQIIFTF